MRFVPLPLNPTLSCLPPSAGFCDATELTSSPLQTRSFASVIFRRIASKTRKIESGENLDLFFSLAKDQAAAIRQKLLETLAAEPERMIRNKISDAVAEVARQYTENGSSPTRILCPLLNAVAVPRWVPHHWC